jgi:hypothetical protein
MGFSAADLTTTLSAEVSAALSTAGLADLSPGFLSSGFS